MLGSLLGHDGSLLFLCHESMVEKVLCISGRQGIFYKVHKNDPSHKEFELLWLEDDTELDKALQLSSDPKVFGLVEKGKSGRLALRFQDGQSLSAFAVKHQMHDTSKVGRWKVSGIPLDAGIHGLFELLRSLEWGILEIAFMDEYHAVFLADRRGQDVPAYFQRNGQPRQIKFKALNAAARGMVKHENMERTTASASTQVPESRAARQKKFLQDLESAAKTPQRGDKRNAEDKTGETPDLQRQKN
jgi:hypothetical protein